MVLRRASERGRAKLDWLESYHTFSFSDYYDPEYMGYRDLRVINEDRIAPGKGFSTHPHRDMEIITYVVSGELEHRDTLGNQSIIRSGEVQRMSAGTGVKHSEYNPSTDQETHLLQIWILPERKGLTPGYAQKDFSELLREKKLVLAVSRDGRDGSLTMNQDVDVYVGRWSAADECDFQIRPGRALWLQIVKGEFTVEDHLGKDLILRDGDGLALADQDRLRWRSSGPAEFILFDLA